MQSPLQLGQVCKYLPLDCRYSNNLIYHQKVQINKYSTESLCNLYLYKFSAGINVKIVRNLASLCFAVIIVIF